MQPNTKLLTAEKEEDILEVISILARGEVVAIPTETVYGLAADAKNNNAVKKLFKVKNRPFYHPLIVHISAFEKLSEWAKDIPPAAEILAKQFWPGPMTLLLKKHDSVNNVVTGGLQTIAIRIPKNQAILQILDALDTGLAAPSANLHKRISPTTSQHVISALSGKIAAVLDGGQCSVGVESTIIDLTKSKVTILRHGPITKKMIESVLNESIDSPLVHSENVPGNMQSHYQPYTKTCLMSLDQIKLEINADQNQNKFFGVIHHSDWHFSSSNLMKKKLSKIKKSYSREIYKALHELDKVNAYKILVESPPTDEAWQDVIDRLSKASVID